MTSVCPNCGYDIIKDTPVQRNGFAMHGPSGPLMFGGEVVPLSRAQNNLVWTLIKAAPRPVGRDALLLRTGSEECTGNSVEVQMFRIRAALRKSGLEPLDYVETIPRQGYRWKA